MALVVKENKTKDITTGNGLVGRLRRTLEDNIGTDLKERDVNTGSWIDSVLDRDYLIAA